MQHRSMSGRSMELSMMPTVATIIYAYMFNVPLPLNHTPLKLILATYHWHLHNQSYVHNTYTDIQTVDMQPVVTAAVAICWARRSC